MTVPATILEMLQNSENVSYTVTDAISNSEYLSVVPKTNAQCLVKGLIFKDNKNQYCQVLVSSDSVVDLDTMFRHFGRQFEGVNPSEIWQIIHAKGLNSVPAVPEWQAMPTFIDDSLTKQESLLLDSGDSEQLLKVNNESFKELIKTCQIGAFASKAPQISESSHEDESKILSAVERFSERRIRQRLDETLDLPPLPETAQRIIKLRADPNADINDLTNIVEIDPSLAAQVVSWAASPYYSAPGKIKSVHDAIVRVLGFDMVLNLALGLSLGKTLSMKVLSKQDIDAYWRGAVYTAAAVEGLVTSINREHRPGFGMAYLSGLLNNFGQLILADVFPPYYELLNRARNANTHIHSAAVEMHTIGVSGNQIAGWLLENWNMPDEVVTALRFQNSINYSGENHTYAKLNFVAQKMLANQGFGNGAPTKLPNAVFESLHLDREMAQATIANILESGDDLDAIADKMRG